LYTDITNREKKQVYDKNEKISLLCVRVATLLQRITVMITIMSRSLLLQHQQSRITVWWWNIVHCRQTTPTTWLKEDACHTCIIIVAGNGDYNDACVTCSFYSRQCGQGFTRLAHDHAEWGAWRSGVIRCR